jgi:transcriptional regulator with XRE-family HTH domain
MVEFGQLLGVSHAQISRYEADQAVPSYLPLGRLLHLAEGVEKNPILEQLRTWLGAGAENYSAAQALHEIERMGHFSEPYYNSLAPPAAGDRSVWWKELEQFTPNLAELVLAVDKLCTRRQEVPSSLAKVMQLWIEKGDGSTEACFSEAAQFLEYLLRVKSTTSGPAPPAPADLAARARGILGPTRRERKRQAEDTPPRRKTG